jgi:hypothetical protein
MVLGDDTETSEYSFGVKRDMPPKSASMFAHENPFLYHPEHTAKMQPSVPSIEIALHWII